MHLCDHGRSGAPSGVRAARSPKTAHRSLRGFCTIRRTRPAPRAAALALGVGGTVTMCCRRAFAVFRLATSDGAGRSPRVMCFFVTTIQGSTNAEMRLHLRFRPPPISSGSRPASPKSRRHRGPQPIFPAPSKAYHDRRAAPEFGRNARHYRARIAIRRRSIGAGRSIGPAMRNVRA